MNRINIQDNIIYDLSFFYEMKVPTINDYYSQYSHVFKKYSETLMHVYNTKEEVDKLYYTSKKGIKMRLGRTKDLKPKLIFDNNMEIHIGKNTNILYIDGKNEKEYYSERNIVKDDVGIFTYDKIYVSFGKNIIHLSDNSNYNMYFDYDFKPIGFIVYTIEKDKESGVFNNFEVIVEDGKYKLIFGKCKLILYSEADKIFEKENTQFNFQFGYSYFVCKLIEKEICDIDDEDDEDDDNYSSLNEYHIFKRRNMSGTIPAKPYIKFSLKNPTSIELLTHISCIMKEDYYYYDDGSIQYDGKYFYSKTNGKIKMLPELFKKIHNLDEMTIIQFSQLSKNTNLETTTYYGSSKRSR